MYVGVFCRKNKPFADFQNSIFCRLINNASQKKIDFVLLLHILLVLFILIRSLSDKISLDNIIMHIIDDFFLMYYFPVLILVCADFLFLLYLLPFIRKLIFKINFYFEYISKTTLFHSSLTNKEAIAFSSTSPIESYVFLLPSINDEDKKEIKKYLTSLASFIWTIRLGVYSKLREYVYLIVLLLVFVIGFILVYEVYYQVIVEVNPEDIKNRYILLYLLTWLIYVIMRLKTITGTHYNYTVFPTLWAKSNSPNVLDQIVIYGYKIEEGILVDKYEYTSRNISEDIESNRESKSLDSIIEFSTTVIAMMIMQFIT